MNRIEYLIKHNRAIQLMYRIVFSTLFSILTFFVPINKKMVLISSFSGKKYNDSPRAIYEEMVRRNLLKDYKVIWAFVNPKEFSEFGLNTVKINSFKYFFIAFRAKYWITNVNIERGLHFKKRKQIYLNTWHGTGPKTIGKAANGRNDYNFKKVNYLCADGEYLRDILVRDLNAKSSNVVLCGRPREDILYKQSDDIKFEMMRKYGIKEKDFVILYAPTWREPKKRSKISSFDLDLEIDKILEISKNIKVLFRAHSITAEINSKIGYSDRFISVTEEPDISNLFFITDVLITDFSSSVFDIAILNKPFICYAPDYSDYIKTRSLYFDLEKEYPFGVQHNTFEVIKKLKEIIDGNRKIDELRALKEKYSPYGGNATKTCVDLLFNQSNSKN